MSRIDPQIPSTVTRLRQPNRPDGNVARPIETVRPATAPRELSAVALANLITVIRRPPPLARRDADETGGPAYEGVLRRHALPLSKLSSSELAFMVSHLVFRRQADIGPETSARIVAGFFALSKLARMYEHLAILRTGLLERD